MLHTTGNSTGFDGLTALFMFNSTSCIRNNRIILFIPYILTMVSETCFAAQCQSCVPVLVCFSVSCAPMTLAATKSSPPAAPLSSPPAVVPLSPQLTAAITLTHNQRRNLRRKRLSAPAPESANSVGSSSYSELRDGSGP